MNRFPFAFLTLLGIASSFVDAGGIRFQSISGDPLLAGKDQNLTFFIAHAGNAYSCFEFVFEVSRGEEMLFQKKVTFFKVPSGTERVSFSVPGAILGKGVPLRFEARLEHTSSSLLGSSYVCYQKKRIVQAAKSVGASLYPDGEEDQFVLGGPYYPSLSAESSYFVFSGGKKNVEGIGNRFGLGGITARGYNIPEEFVKTEKIGELRIYTDFQRWKIGEKKNKFTAVPLSFTPLGSCLFRLCLSKEYGFSPYDGEMREGGDSPYRTKDLIIPVWQEGMPLRFSLCLNSFTPLEETIVFSRHFTPSFPSFSPSGEYWLNWEEL